MPSIPPWLERVILRAMEKNPDDRFPDAAALAHALDRAGADPSSAPSQVATDRPGPTVLPMDLGPTIATPPSGLSGVDSPPVDPGAPTLQTPASGNHASSAPSSGAPSASSVAPTLPAPATPPPAPPVPPVPPTGTGPASGRGDPGTAGPPTTGPQTVSSRPAAWWPVAAAVVVLALVAAAAVGYLVLGPGESGQQSAPTPIGDQNSGTQNAAGGDLAEAERLLAAGDLPAARRQVDGYLARNPDDAEAQELERRLRHAEDSLAQALAAGDLLGEIGDAPSELDEPLTENDPADEEHRSRLGQQSSTGSDPSGAASAPKPGTTTPNEVESPTPPPVARCVRPLLRPRRAHRCAS